MKLLHDRVREIGQAFLVRATLVLRECGNIAHLYLRMDADEPVYVGSVHTKVEAYEALLAFKELGLGPQPDFLAAVRRSTCLRGEMPTRLQVPTAGDVRDFGRGDAPSYRTREFDFVLALALTLL